MSLFNTDRPSLFSSRGDYNGQPGKHVRARSMSRSRSGASAVFREGAAPHTPSQDGRRGGGDGRGRRGWRRPDATKRGSRCGQFGSAPSLRGKASLCTESKEGLGMNSAASKHDRRRKCHAPRHTHGHIHTRPRPQQGT